MFRTVLTISTDYLPKQFNRLFFKMDMEPFMYAVRIEMFVYSLTLRLLMSYIYIYIYVRSKLFLMFLDHTQDRSPAEIVGSNPTGGMDICLV